MHETFARFNHDGIMFLQIFQHIFNGTMQFIQVKLVIKILKFIMLFCFISHLPDGLRMICTVPHICR